MKFSTQVFTEITLISFEIPFGIARAVYGQEKAWTGDYQGFVGQAQGRDSDLRSGNGRGRGGHLFSGHASISHRRLGYGEATMRAAVKEMQGRTGVGPDGAAIDGAGGHPLYRRMGFRDATRFTVYLTK